VVILIPMKISIYVRKLFYLSKLVNLHSEPIYKIVSVNDHEMLNIVQSINFQKTLKIVTGNVLCGDTLNLLWSDDVLFYICRLQ